MGQQPACQLGPPVMQRQSDDGGKPQDVAATTGLGSQSSQSLMLVTTDLIESIRPFIIAGKPDE